MDIAHLVFQYWGLGTIIGFGVFVTVLSYLVGASEYSNDRTTWLLWIPGLMGIVALGLALDPIDFTWLAGYPIAAIAAGTAAVIIPLTIYIVFGD